VRLTDANAAVFDAAHGFAGVIAGVHEVLRGQGLLEGIWCLDPDETLSPGQREELERVRRSYPELTDDDFVADAAGRLHPQRRGRRRGRQARAGREADRGERRAGARDDRACERAGVTLGVVFQSRFKPHPQAVRDAVERGALGDLVLGSMAVKWLRDPPTTQRRLARHLGLRRRRAADQPGDPQRRHAAVVDGRRGARPRHDHEPAPPRHRGGGHGRGAARVRERRARGDRGDHGAYPGSARRVELHGTAGTITLLDDEVGEWDLRDGTPAPGRTRCRPPPPSPAPPT
jgi:hypothetical protein